MNSPLQKIWNVITWAAVVLILILAILLAGVRFIGFTPFSVLSGSMAPTYNTGDLIYVRSVDYRTLEPGDVITFLLNEKTVATHRIVEVIADKDDPEVYRFRTKGDANNVEDGGLVHGLNIIGVPVFSIPYLGYVAHFIQNPPGMYLAIAAAAVLVIIILLPEFFSKPSKEEENPQSAERGIEI